MRLIKKIVVVAYTMLFLQLSPVSVIASSYYNSETFQVYVQSHEEAEAVYNRLCFSVQKDNIDIDTLNAPIQAFAVSKSNYVAIGLKGDAILILAPDNHPIRYIDFKQEIGGGVYGLDFFGDNLGITLTEDVLTISIDGELLELTTPLPYTESSSYFPSTWGRYRESIIKDDTTYKLKNDFGPIQSILGGWYGALVKVDSQGNEVYLYDVRARFNIWFILLLVFIVGLVGGVGIAFIKKIVNRKKLSVVNTS